MKNNKVCCNCGINQACGNAYPEYPPCVTENNGTQSTDTQQLKAEICTLIKRGYSTTGDTDGQISEREFINELCKLVGY